MGSTATVPTDNPMGLMPEDVDPDLDLANPGMNNGAVTSPVDTENPGDDVVNVFAEAYMKMIEERLRDLVEESGLDATSVEIVREEDGVYLRIRDAALFATCLLYTSPSPRDRQKSRMPSSA